MKISSLGIAFIKHQEGYSASMYTDMGGNPSIGFGHRLFQGESFPRCITPAQADALLQKDIVFTEAAVNQLVTVPLNQNQFDALCDFVFNLGPGRLDESVLLELLNEGDYNGAANQFPRWCHCNGDVEPVLLRRREAEMELFQTKQ